MNELDRYDNLSEDEKLSLPAQIKLRIGYLVTQLEKQEQPHEDKKHDNEQPREHGEDRQKHEHKVDTQEQEQPHENEQPFILFKKGYEQQDEIDD
ncbi:hypothetical protein [Rummeliibacillus suwonensis]|uniref:hypothetical protein n=1 Tax=Rummeliibacillus suwonensis TaxID=1306154 RepID=UPI001AAF5C82|nr:hypothetical protein [Rummeliibacillus suwonensis]MBO2536291.1 hypothetical protein [Rummeliibacillus suwonensis]